MAMPNSAQIAKVFRITHRDNLPLLLKHGICARNHKDFGDDYINIGSIDVISKREAKSIDINGIDYGTLHDYVPFYFTPLSPMLYNILTGFNNIPKKPRKRSLSLSPVFIQLGRIQITG
jgi:hypothetical protein